MNSVNSSNFNATILKFSEKFDHSFLHVFVFGNMCPVSHGFVVVPVKVSNNLVSLHDLDWDKSEHVSLIQLVTGMATKPWLAGNMFPYNYKNMRKWMIEIFRKFENRDIKIARVNSILITKSINLFIYFNFVRG